MEDTPQGPNDNAPPPPTPPPAEPPPPQDLPPTEIVSDNRSIMIVLSYLGLLALIPLLVDKDDNGVLGAISGGLGCLFGLLWPVFMLVILVVHILCIVKGLNGQRFLIPGISEYADRF